jgi:hypothetical protein
MLRFTGRGYFDNDVEVIITRAVLEKILDSFLAPCRIVQRKVLENVAQNFVAGEGNPVIMKNESTQACARMGTFYRVLFASSRSTIDP